MANTENKTQVGNIVIYHECIPREMAERACKLFEMERNKGTCRDGQTGSGINKKYKDSIDIVPQYESDCSSEMVKLAYEIEQHVTECLIDYYKVNPNMLYSLSTDFSMINYETLPDPEIMIPRVASLQHGQYQYYPPAGQAGHSIDVGGGYPSNHSESCPWSHVATDRILTWMMTLNDLPVTEEQYGYTVFTGQNIAVRPKAGQLVLFSPWTDCEHRGNRVNNVDKTIVTSWVVYS